MPRKLLVLARVTIGDRVGRWAPVTHLGMTAMESVVATRVALEEVGHPYCVRDYMDQLFAGKTVTIHELATKTSTQFRMTYADGSPFPPPTPFHTFPPPARTSDWI